jgi:hypothetical protein
MLGSLGGRVIPLLFAAAHAATIDLCDGIDEDGDGAYDEDAPVLALFQDLDGDTWGAGVERSGCADVSGVGGVYHLQDPAGAPPTLVVAGFVTNELDCNDFNSNLSPDAIEICDDLDNDCNDVVDDAEGGSRFFPDGDGDGYGVGEGEPACAPPDSSSVRVGGDCDDLDPEVSPGADEVCDDGVDDDCSGLADDDCATADPIDDGGATDPIDDGGADGGCGCDGAGGGGAPWLAAIGALLLGRKPVRLVRRGLAGR